MDQDKIKEIIKQEYIKCASDPVHFLKKYCYIKHPQRGRILFHLYPFQEDVFSELTVNRLSIINKSRQLGISTLVAGLSLHTMLFNKDKTILCIATKQETAKGMVEKVQFMHQNLPSWLKGPHKPLSNNKLSLKLKNNSEIIASSAASDSGRSYAISMLILDEVAFIEGIETLITSVLPTISSGGKVIALSSPNGIGNWFHKTYTEAQFGKNDFKPIELKWDLHPERDEKWEMTERANMSPREFAQEYDCDFLGSGNSVVDNDILSFYEQSYIKEPIERRFMGGDLWIWEYADNSRSYIISADVARGDGSDYSTFQVIDIEACEQVAEYRSQIGTREFGHMLCSVATEYNNALLIPENASMGWDVVNTIIERNYPNLYYSPKSHGELSMDKYLAKLDNDQTVPGFTNSTRTRPLVIAKMESYIRERAFIFHSKRLAAELRTFIWLNGKAQAQSGYNDDLVMALGIGLFIRDTSLKFLSQGMDATRNSLTNISRTSYQDLYPSLPGGFVNIYTMQDGHGNNEDLRWLLK